MSGLPYQLSSPRSTLETPEPAPLYVYLHGAGGAGTDNRAQLQRGSGFALSRLREAAPGAWLLAPQCPRTEAWWSPTDQPSRSGRRLMELVEHLCTELALDSGRLFLLGVSMGGHGVWDLGWRFPERWNALVPICGAVPVTRVDRLAQTSIWCFHGELDQEVPVEGTRRVVTSLEALGGEIRYTELPGIGHSCTRQVFERDDFLKWLANR